MCLSSVNCVRRYLQPTGKRVDLRMWIAHLTRSHARNHQALDANSLSERQNALPSSRRLAAVPASLLPSHLDRLYHLACSFCGSKRGTLITVGGTLTKHALLPCSFFPLSPDYPLAASAISLDRPSLKQKQVFSSAG